MKRWLGPLVVSLMLGLPAADSFGHGLLKPAEKEDAAPSQPKVHMKDTSATPSHQKSATPVTGVQHAGVAVEVQVIDATQSKDIFDVDLISKGVQPLFIRIHNGSIQPHRFRKASVDARYIPAAEAAEQAYENPVVIGGRLLGQTVGLIPRIIFSKTHRKASSSSVFNREVQDNFVKEEIADTDIKANGSLSGFLYVRPLEGGHPLTVTLINLQTQQPLVFEFPAP